MTFEGSDRTKGPLAKGLRDSHIWERCDISIETVQIYNRQMSNRRTKRGE